MSDEEFLEMTPAAFELLMRRLRAWDRKALDASMTGAAMICAQVWNSAGKSIDFKREGREPYTASDFLPETPEARRDRLEQEEVLRERPAESPAFATFKSGLTALAGQTPEQKAATAALIKRGIEASRKNRS